MDDSLIYDRHKEVHVKLSKSLVEYVTHGIMTTMALNLQAMQKKQLLKRPPFLYMSFGMCYSASHTLNYGRKLDDTPLRGVVRPSASL